jgi:hypothetical protein
VVRFGAAARHLRAARDLHANGGRWVQFQDDPATLEAVRAFAASPE